MRDSITKLASETRLITLGVDGREMSTYVNNLGVAWPVQGAACDYTRHWSSGAQDPKLSAAQIPTEPQEAVPLGTGCLELVLAGLRVFFCELHSRM